MDRFERYEDMLQALRDGHEGHQSGLWTALPGIIQGYDATKQTASIRPAIRCAVTSEKGDVKQVEISLLVDVPVIFPGGGGYTLTFPMKSGDEVLVVFACRCIDSWWQSGGVQNQAEFRLHDLSDGFAIPQPRSQPRKLTNVSTTAAQLRSDNGNTFIEIQPTSVNINNGDTFIEIQPTLVHIKSPTQAILDGDIKVNGTVTARAFVTAP